MPRRRVLLVLISAATVLALTLVLALDRGGPRPGVASSSGSHFAGAALPAGVPARDFTLQDQYGRRVSLESSRGQVTMLAFVASSCGSACELIAQQIRGALDDLPRAVPVLLVSVDPAADTPARVSAFLARVSLAGRARYLTGTRPALAPVWRAYGVRPPSAGRGAFERSASVLLLDRDGRARVIFGLEQLTPEGLAHDVRALW
jgi:protein SCO1/2